ncbi:hypothetical protein KFL_000920320 [Klebsormidium nitens]|uniref:Uncharacterized protein n=1 Tax=Klebsormidium nitens TaxID=105231 RepID=A0A0U9HJ61_KLENI|nr:hypothetical protein KFL_000920320 [Klebsormidium nitens]|eukprot:GAQ81848.1 hypothetical protein KFL_000920320 [Klebsormidium nitens]
MDSRLMSIQIQSFAGRQASGKAGATNTPGDQVDFPGASLIERATWIFKVGSRCKQGVFASSIIGPDSSLSTPLVIHADISRLLLCFFRSISHSCSSRNPGHGTFRRQRSKPSVPAAVSGSMQPGGTEYRADAFSTTGGCTSGE